MGVWDQGAHNSSILAQNSPVSRLKVHFVDLSPPLPQIPSCQYTIGQGSKALEDLKETWASGDAP